MDSKGETARQPWHPNHGLAKLNLPLAKSLPLFFLSMRKGYLALVLHAQLPFVTGLDVVLVLKRFANEAVTAKLQSHVFERGHPSPHQIRLSLALIITPEGLPTPGLISYGFFFGWAGGCFGWSGGCVGLRWRQSRSRAESGSTRLSGRRSKIRFAVWLADVLRLPTSEQASRSTSGGRNQILHRLRI
jgi:hypothetical protein